MSLDTELRKPGFKEGLKLGAGYYVDPLGRMLQNWENVAINGRALRETYSQTLFERLGDDARTGNSVGKYVGAGLGIAAAAATIAIASVPYATMAVSTFAFDMYKTFSNERAVPDTEYHPSFWEGARGGFGIGVDPAGFVFENLERNLVNGKGIDENRVVSVTQHLTRDARQGNSWRKYVGGAVGLGVGSLISYASFGAVPLITAVYDIGASIGNRQKRLPPPAVEEIVVVPEPPTA